MKRAAAIVGIAGILASTGCSAESAKPSANVSAWKAGHAVVVVVADVASGPLGDAVDYSDLGTRPGVIAVWSKGTTLRLSLSRQAMLVDLAALKLELERTPGLSNVRQTFVPPT